jgi:hypothetical protein
MTEEERRDYATYVIFNHARDVVFSSIRELADDYEEDMKISRKDAKLVADLITQATVTVGWPDGLGGDTELGSIPE